MKLYEVKIGQKYKIGELEFVRSDPNPGGETVYLGFLTEVELVPRTFNPGDVLLDGDGLSDLPKGTILRDADGDAWSNNNGIWRCTDGSGHFDCDGADPGEYAPLTILYLPNAED